jgi:acetyl esterase/lipase
MQAFAEHWATDAGCASVLFDYRGFGRSDGAPRNVVSLAAQHEDFCAVLRWVREQPDSFQLDRIVVMGCGAAGLAVARLAAEDERLAGAMMHAPLLDGAASGTRCAQLADQGWQGSFLCCRWRRGHGLPSGPRSTGWVPGSAWDPYSSRRSGSRARSRCSTLRPHTWVRLLLAHQARVDWCVQASRICLRTVRHRCRSDQTSSTHVRHVSSSPRGRASTSQKRSVPSSSLRHRPTTSCLCR